MIMKKCAGVVCYRYNNIGNIEFLVVAKKYSDTFIRLVTGKYKNIDETKLTFFESYMISKFPISQIYKEYFNNKITTTSEYKNEQKFMKYLDDKFMSHKTLIFKTYVRSTLSLKLLIKKPLIADIINNFYNMFLFSINHISDNIIWEIPKGGIEKNESSIMCAKRELIEETNIYDIGINAVNTTTISLRYHNTIYEITYYYAKIPYDNKYITIRNDKEIMMSRWVLLEEIEKMNMSKQMKKILFSVK